MRSGLAILLVWFVAACGDPAVLECFPGATVFCSCETVGGVQTCRDDHRFGACVCDLVPDAGAPDATVGPDASVPTEDTLVADLGTRSVELEVAGIAGTFAVHGLSRVGLDIEVIATPISATEVQKAPGLVTMPDISARAISSNDASGAADFADWLTDSMSGTPQPRPVTLTMTGLSGETIELTLTATAIAGDPAVTAGVLAEVVLRPSAITAHAYTQALPLPLEAHPGKRLEVESIAIGHAPFANLAYPAEGETTNLVWREVGSADDGESAAFVEWMFATEQAVEIDVQTLPRHNLSVVDLNAAGSETGRVNAFETWPYRINFFNPTRPYGTTHLINLFIAVEHASNG